MRTSSCKAKGQRASKEARDLLLKFAPQLQPDDIIVTPSGVPGEDLRLSPAARALYPFNFEMKNVEKINIWGAILQARAHGKHIPAVVFKKNNEELQITLKFQTFLEILHGSLKNNIQEKK